MYQDYKDLLFAFHAHGVRYLIVGGFAVILHAQPRFTKDLDLFIKAHPANGRALFAALADFWVVRDADQGSENRDQFLVVWAVVKPTHSATNAAWMGHPEFALRQG